MPRGRPKGSKNKIRGPEPSKAPVPPDKALKALAKRLKTLEWDIHDLTRSIQLREAENHTRESGEFQKIYARIAAVGDRLDTLDSQEDDREERLAAAIEQATTAAKVLERVELGLRPMLIRALEASEFAEPEIPQIPRAREPVDHIERYYAHLAYQSSLRS